LHPEPDGLEQTARAICNISSCLGMALLSIGQVGCG